MQIYSQDILVNDRSFDAEDDKWLKMFIKQIGTKMVIFVSGVAQVISKSFPSVQFGTVKHFSWGGSIRYTSVNKTQENVFGAIVVGFVCFFPLKEHSLHRIQNLPIQEKGCCTNCRLVNGSQLAKMNKDICLTCPYHKIYRVGAVGLYFSNYDFCKYFKCGAILCKIDILSTA